MKVFVLSLVCVGIFAIAVINGYFVEDTPFITTPEPTPIPSDKSVLIQEVCKFPCWEGITPGKSKIDDTYDKLINIPFYTSALNKSEESYDKLDLPNKSNTILISWWYDDPAKKNFIVLEKGVVSSISIFPNIVFSLRDVLQIYGDPSGTQVVYDAGSETPYLHIKLVLYYPKKGLIIEFLLYSSDSVNFVPKVDVSPEIQGINFRLYPRENTLGSLVEKTLSSGYPYPVLPIWIGVGNVLISPSETFPFGLPQLVTATPQH